MPSRIVMKDYSRGAPVLTVCLETFYHHLPLGLVLEEVTEELFLIRIILTYPFKASLYLTLHVPLVESQTEIEDSAS
jgi:hypothetical protein